VLDESKTKRTEKVKESAPLCGLSRKSGLWRQPREKQGDLFSGPRKKGRRENDEGNKPVSDRQRAQWVKTSSPSRHWTSATSQRPIKIETAPQIGERSPGDIARYKTCYQWRKKINSRRRGRKGNSSFA